MHAVEIDVFMVYVWIFHNIRARQDMDEKYDVFRNLFII
jgi:hypothetical protein